jgi:hypothetical protein
MAQEPVAYYQTGGVRIEIKAENGGFLDTVGTLALAVLGLSLLLSLWRSQRRYHQLALEVARLKAK